jgi:hypothetical protein
VKLSCALNLKGGVICEPENLYWFGLLEHITICPVCKYEDFIELWELKCEAHCERITS